MRSTMRYKMSYLIIKLHIFQNLILYEIVNVCVCVYVYLLKWNPLDTDHIGRDVRPWPLYYDFFGGTIGCPWAEMICRILRMRTVVHRYDIDWESCLLEIKAGKKTEKKTWIVQMCMFSCQLLLWINGAILFCSIIPYLIWAIRCSLRVNGLLQTVHTCGLSPEWCFKWLVRCSRRVNTLLQNSHLCGDIPVWIISWLFKCSRLLANKTQKVYCKFNSNAMLSRVEMISNWHVPCKYFVTELAAVRTIAGMFSHMICKVLFSSESFWAIGAFMWTLASMLSHVVDCVDR